MSVCVCGNVELHFMDHLSIYHFLLPFCSRQFIIEILGEPIAPRSQQETDRVLAAKNEMDSHKHWPASIQYGTRLPPAPHSAINEAAHEKGNINKVSPMIGNRSSSIFHSQLLAHRPGLLCHYSALENRRKQVQ